MLGEGASWLGGGGKCARLFPRTNAIHGETAGEISKLRLTHEGLHPDSPLATGVRGGWSQILSAMKTLLKTGKPLNLPAGM